MISVACDVKDGLPMSYSGPPSFHCESEAKQVSGSAFDPETFLVLNLNAGCTHPISSIHALIKSHEHPVQTHVHACVPTKNVVISSRGCAMVCHRICHGSFRAGQRGYQGKMMQWTCHKFCCSVYFHQDISCVSQTALCIPTCRLLRE